MTSIFLNPPSPFPLLHDNQDQSHLLFTTTPQASSSISPIFSNSQQPKENGVQKLGEEADKKFSIGGSIGHQPLLQNSLPSDGHHNIFEASTDKREEGGVLYNIQRENSSIKWMSSKMRLMRKMMNSDRMVENKLAEKMHKFQDHHQPSPSDKNNDNYSPTNTTRVCTDCNTTKTPLWRSGPQGPKSLCNACGIRQRKARRAIAAAAANGELVNSNVTMSSKIHKQKKRSKTDNISHYKKRCKFATSGTRNNLCFEDFTISLSKNSAFHRVFPQDEKDAAILLMALSCGLIRS